MCGVMFGSLQGYCEKSSCKITEVSVKWFQLSEVSIRKATEVELLTWVEGTTGREGERLRPCSGSFER